MVKPHRILLLTSLLMIVVGCLISPKVSAGGEDRAIQELQQTFNQRRPRKEGIRRGGLCALSPGTDVLQKEYVIWSDRPLFLWQADRQITVQRLRVLRSGTDEIVWEQALQPRDVQTTFNGKSLQPGQVYSWELAFQRDPARSQALDVLEYRFQVMNSVQRDRIATELQALTTRLQARGATSEAITLQHARYLADQGLLSDALQVLHALKFPSTETTKLLQELTNSVCQTSKPAQ